MSDERNADSELHLLLAGQIGIGKSSVLQTLLDRDPSSFTPITIKKHLKDGCLIMKTHRVTVNGVKIVIYDAPGLNDPFLEDDNIVKNMIDMIPGSIDLILLCFSMRGRVSKADVSIIEKLHETFNDLFMAKGRQSMWESTVCVLTFGNEVVPPPSSEENPNDYFTERLGEYNSAIKQYVKLKANLREEDLEKLRIVPVGHKSERILPNEVNWIQSLWDTAFSLMDERAQAVFQKFFDKKSSSVAQQ